MNLFPDSIVLNGELHRISDLLENRNALNHPELLLFLEEWYSSNPGIEVQTSGSTGEPKRIHLPKPFVAESARRTIDFFRLKENDSILHCLPLRYIAGKLMVVRALIGNLNLIVEDPSGSFDVLQSVTFRFAAMVPNQVAKILQMPNGAAMLQNIDMLLIGGAPVPHTLHNALQDLRTTCYSSYGMTETATHIALQALNTPDSDRFYHCLDGITVSQTETGCLTVCMNGLPNGQLRTNDLAEVIDDKTFRILGRADQVIISGGIKYIPEQIEKKLEPHVTFPFLITSKPDARLGQRIVLLVEANNSETIQMQLQKICKENLERFEQPREIIFTNALPRTGNGKLKRPSDH